MKHWIILAGIVVLGVASIVLSQRQRIDVPPGPAAVLYLVGDTEQELTRMPVRFTRMSDEEEIRAGDAIAKAYSLENNEKKSAETIEIENYLARVGRGLAAHAHRKLPYRFHYVPGAYYLNAFSLPGGHVYVGEGLLSLMDSEDQLAAVMAHEIEHIDHYHCAERLQQQEALRKSPFGILAALPIEIFQAGYSKEQEFEADREGTRLAVQSGYSANGAIRMFETFQRLYEESQARAKTPQEELSSVALQTLTGYFQAHPPTAERIAQIRSMIASEGWAVRPERDLEIAYIFWTARAEDDYKAHRYDHAEQIALRSLKVKPDQVKALDVLARSQYAKADFSAAASTYRKALQLDPRDLDRARSFADALAAADNQTALSEFQQWLKTAPEEMQVNLRVTVAGLSLFMRNAAPAEALIALRQTTSAMPPESFGELGWWYYRAGNYTKASALLDDAVQLRPSDLNMSTERVWVLIQNQRFADALNAMASPYSTVISSDRVMALSVAQWLAKEPDNALQSFERAVEDQPEWKNPQWVKALYSPLVAESIEQMTAEAVRRKKLAEARAERR